MRGACLMKMCYTTLEQVVTTKHITRNCIGICKKTFEKRYANHKKCFNAEKTRARLNHLLNIGS